MSVEHGVALVRECLESVLPSAVATALLHDALDSHGRTPETLEELRRWVQGPLARILAARLGQDTSEVLVLQVDAQLDAALSYAPPKRSVREREEVVDIDVDVDVDVDASEPDSDVDPTSLIRPIPHAVSVMVVSKGEAFAKRMLLAIGSDRMYALTVSDEGALRHATFRANPNVVVVDTSQPPAIEPNRLAAALVALPDATLIVVFGDRTTYRGALRSALESLTDTVLFLGGEDGVGALHDLILSRRKQTTVIPPPA